MESEGTYRKDRRSITKPVTKVPSSAVEAPRHPDVPTPRGHEGSGNVLIVSRLTSGLLAILVATLLLGLAYVGTGIFAREHQFENFRDRQRHIELEQEQSRAHRRALERRMVELETALENLEERQ